MTTLTFVLPKSHVLNSNTYKNLHWAVKGKLTENLRNLAINEGLPFHPLENVNEVEKKLEQLKEEARISVLRARRTKALQKEGLDAKEIKLKVAEEFASLTPAPLVIAAPPLFDKFRIRVKVSSPTRRRLDPVNLYPTVKALIDGLTDVHWWNDDDYSHLLELSFVYGGLSKEKDTFTLELEVLEVEKEELQNFVLKT